MGRPVIGAMRGAFAVPEDMFAGDKEVAELFDRGRGRLIPEATLLRPLAEYEAVAGGAW